VGTSTLATHLAYYLVRSVPGQSVCLADLDLEKGDLQHLLGASHRLDVGDLAKVADDLGPQTVSSAVHRDSSGLGLLLAPDTIDGVGAVGERETRLILDALRRQFDLVVVDGGAHITPVTAAAVEVADEVVLVTTPDVLALRGVHRALEAWQRVGVRQQDEVKIVVNQASRRSDIQVDSVARLVPIAPLNTFFPAGFKRLEPGLNYRDPGEVKEQDWWSRVGMFANELGLVPESSGRQRPARRKRGDLRRGAVLAEDGQASLEFTALFPLVVLFVVLLWQLALWGATAALAGHAADEGARAASIGQDAESEALDSVPSWFRSGFDVTDSGSTLHVEAEVPLLAPGVTSELWTFSTDVGVVNEP
ncbi:MAG: AAA family ATPase, partial [Nocardioidaceae bacterium]